MAAASDRRWQRRDSLTLLALFAWFTATAWARPLMLPDEGRYVGVAWEMLRSGDWLTPTLDGLPFFHKPPLFYWVTAASLQVFGLHEWAARTAPLLGAFIGGASLYAFALRWSGRRTAELALLALAVEPLQFLGSQYANLDMLVAGIISLTVVLLADAALRIEHGLPYRRSLMGAYAAAAFGLLAKGLIGFVLPALAAVVALAATRRLKRVLTLLSLPGLVVFAVIAGPWIVAMQMRFPRFLDYFFVEQHFRRFAATGFNNVQPWWFYVALLALATLPWWPWLWNARRAPSQARTDADTLRMVRVWMLAGAGAIVFFFSLPASKLIGYVLPAVPPLMWLVAYGYSRATAGSALARGGWLAGLAMWAVLGLGIVYWLSTHDDRTSRPVGQALAAARAPGEPIYMIEGYAYDTPLYARLTEPVPIFDDWASPDVRRNDNWRKEVADAGDFDPPLAAKLLLPLSTLSQRLCSAPVSWVIAAPNAAPRFAVLGASKRVAGTSKFVLWRVERRAASDAGALKCPGKPNDDSR